MKRAAEDEKIVMDIARPSQAAAKRRRRILMGAGGLAAVLLITLGLSRLKPAAPSVERATVWIDTVKQGEMLRNVRGLGTLVPEEIRWIAAQTEGRVERRVLLPGAVVTPDSVILELSNPELELLASDADQALRAAQASYIELKVRLESQYMDQTAVAARVKAEYHQARMRADADKQLAEQGLIADITMQLSKVTAEELENRERDRAAAPRHRPRGHRGPARRAAHGGRAEAGHGATAPGPAQRAQAEGGHGRGPAAAPGRGGPASHPRHEPGARRPARQAEGRRAHRGDPGQGRADRPEGTVDTRNGVIEAHVMRVDPAVENGTVAVDLYLDGALPKGARPDLSVDGTIELERLTDVLFVGRPAQGQADSLVSLFRLEETGSEANRVKVKLGRTSVNTVEILSGLKIGDQVVLSDTSAWDAFDRIRLN